MFEFNGIEAFEVYSRAADSAERCRDESAWSTGAGGTAGMAGMAGACRADGYTSGEGEESNHD